MEIILFTHPDFLKHKSMLRFSGMIENGMKARGHNVTLWSPAPVFYNFSGNRFLNKWLGYIDQYILFPQKVRKQVRDLNADTLFVVADQALGPWVPLIKDRNHVVHCHDFLAQRSALGEIKENPTSFTGKLYQDFIRRGYSKAKNFISVSHKTADDLQQFLDTEPKISEVVYNGLNQSFTRIDATKARAILSEKFGLNLNEGFILHVGGNQWYKNRSGVIQIYDAWRSTSDKKLPLLLIGESKNPELAQKKSVSKYGSDIFFLTDIADEQVKMAYNAASVLLFPSLAEGFGWPIAEAMASGCPVITTNAAPMTEVAGDAAFLIPGRPIEPNKIIAWAHEAGKVVEQVVNLSPVERELVIKAGIENAARFETGTALDKIEKIYLQILLNKY